MGRYGSSILTIAGTIIGAYFGGSVGASVGSLAGSLLGSVLFPTKLPTQTGPRLTDTSSTASTVGTPIPRGWGTFPASGCIIWQGDYKEVDEKSEVGGKGAPSQTVETPTYFQSFAIGINDGLIGGIRVMWANGKPIYDRRPKGGTDTHGTAETDQQYKARMAASNQLESQFTLYLGTEDQLTDPTMEAVFGVGNISAFRGLAYIVFTDWQNKPEDGMRMPASWRFEVYNEATATDDDGSNYSIDILDPWVAQLYPLNPQGLYQFVVRQIDQDAYNNSVLDGHPFDFTTVYNTLADAQATAGFTLKKYGNNADCSVYIDYSLSPDNAISPVISMLGGPIVTAYDPVHDPLFVDLHFNIKTPQQYYLNTQFTAPPNAGTGVEFANSGAVFWTTNSLWETSSVPGSVDIFPGPFPPANSGYTHGSRYGSYFWYYELNDLVIKAQRVPRAPKDPCDTGTPVPGLDGWVIDSDAQLVKCGTWIKVTTPIPPSAIYNSLCLQKFQNDNVKVYYPLNPCLPTDHPDALNEQMWTDAYLKAVKKGLMKPGMTYQAGGTTGLDGTLYPSLEDHYYQRQLTLESKTTGVVAVSQIVSDICKEAGLTDADIDVSEVTGIFVIGYIRSNVMSARDAISPLAQGCFFDGIESNGKITTRRRGQSIVKTLTRDDLGAYVTNGDDQPPTRMQSVDSQDVDLPRSIRVHYLAQSRDYDPSEQDSPLRVDTSAVNDVDLQLPIVLSDDQAKQIAEKIWASSWAERTGYATTLDQAPHLDLEAADCIAAPIDGEVVRLRITSVTDSIPATRAIQLVVDDAASFVSYAVASQVPVNNQQLSIVTPAAALLMDLPLLRDQDNDAGFYTALYGLLPDVFKAASLYRSVDGGGNFQRLISSNSSAVTGTVVNAVLRGPTTIIDHGNKILVELYDTQDTLDSITYDTLLGGGNAIAIGEDDRWEIVQFQTATHVVDNLYELSDLLRGRRGTEWAVGTSQPGDSFVVLSGIVRTQLDISQLNRSFVYKPVGAGSTLDSTQSINFTGEGVALVPFSPAYITATRDQISGDWVFSWLRRGRIGQTLQSGKDVALSEFDEDYEVDVINPADGTIARTLSISQPTATYTGVAQITDLGSFKETLRVAVYQISDSVGRGYPGIKDFTILNQSAAGPQPPAHSGTLLIKFGGVFNVDNDTTIILSFVLNGSPYATQMAFTVNGAGKTTLAGYATDLAAQLTTALGGDATVSIVTGTTVKIVSTTHAYSATILNHHGYSNILGYQNSGPPTVGILNAAQMDFYDHNALAPDADPASYQNGSDISAIFRIGAYDAVENHRISLLQAPAVPMGINVGQLDNPQGGLKFTIGGISTGAGDGRLSLLNKFATALIASSDFAPYLYNASVSQSSGWTDGYQSRPSLVLTMKDGYFLYSDLADQVNSTGYGLRISLLRTGVTTYTGAGRKQISAVQWREPFDGRAGGLGYVSDIEIGETFRITADGVNFDHVIDSADMDDVPVSGDYQFAAYPTQHYLDGIYADLKTQLEATTKYSVQLSKQYRNMANTTFVTQQMTITRAVGNAPFSLVAQVLPAFSMTITLASV